MTKRFLKPQTTFAAIYGGDLVYIGRSSPTASRWLPREHMVMDMRTGGIGPVGDMPAVCAASVSTPECLGLLRDAGLHVPPEIYRYYGTADYLALLKQLSAEGRTFSVHHVHPVIEIPAENSWIAPALLSFLNNKANLNKLVPAENLPDREILPVEKLARMDWNKRMPVVIKAVTDESTGGGVDVRICRKIADIGRAVSYFASCRLVVVERYLPIRQNLCLHYAVKHNDEVDYLGFAEQVSDEEGRYHGNWIDTRGECPEVAVHAGLAVARAGARYGYTGLLGVDIAILEDGTCRVFDLNFRINGSTTAVLYADAIHRRYGTPVIRRQGFKGKGSYRDLLDAVHRAMAGGLLLPLGSCDPQAGPYPQKRPLLTALVLGKTRNEIIERERELKSMGLS